MESAISSLRNERKLFLEALTAARTIVSATLSHVLIRTRLTSSIFLCDLEHALSGAQTALNYPWDLDFANSELFKTSQCRSLRATFGWRAWPALLRSQTLKIHVYVLVRPFSPKLQRLFKDGFRLISIYFLDLSTKNISTTFQSCCREHKPALKPASESIQIEGAHQACFDCVSPGSSSSGGFKWPIWKTYFAPEHFVCFSS